MGLILLAVILRPGLVERSGGARAAMFRGEYSPWIAQMARMYQRVDATVPEGAVVFIGDSITQGLAVAAVTSPAVNFGIGRDTSAGVLRRLPDYGSLSRARLVVLAIGVNDLAWRENPETVANIETILDRIQDEHGTPVILSAVLPIDDDMSASHRRENREVLDLNRRLAALAADRPQVRLVDATESMVDEQGNLDDAYHVGDGVHLSPAGYARWIAALKSAMAVPEDLT